MVLNKIIIHTQDRVRFITQGEIVFCKSDNCYTYIYLVSGEEILISKSLSKFTQGLDPERFIRANQSYLINTQYIKSIDKKKRCVELLNLALIPFTTTIKELLEMIGTPKMIDFSDRFHEQ